jgi:DUF4097 and DUF4098 domain-containing protein YvlB
MTYRPAFSALILAAALAAPADTLAGDTRRDTRVADAPRAARLDRYAAARQGPEQTDRFSETYRVGRDSSLDLQNLAGDIHITGGTGSEIKVEAIKRVRSRDEADGRRRLDALRIEATQVGNRVEIRTVHPRMNGRGSESVEYTVSVPSSAAVSVRTVSGDVVIGSVNGEVRAEAVSGNVRVSATPNLALAKTVSGDVTARDIGGSAVLALGSVSGTINVSALKARALEAGTVSGDVLLSNVQADRVTGKSVSGSIELDAALARGGRYAFNSHSGDIRIHLDGGTGFELDANTFSGSIRSDFPITLRSSGRSDRNSHGRGTRAIRGSYGDGSAIIEVRSFSGSVVITRR